MPIPRRRRTRLLIACVSALSLFYLGLTAANASAADTLLSQGKLATASSTESAAFPAANAVDGNTGTRWSSAFADPQWLQVDLGAPATISSVQLNWEAAYATGFQIQTSTDAATWNTIYSTTAGTGGNQNLTVSGSGRFVRVYTTARATQWGISLWEFQVYGSLTGSTTGPTTPATTPAGGCSSDNSALGRDAIASSEENNGVGPSLAVDGSATTRWSSLFADPQWLQVDLSTSQTICSVTLQWEAAYATAFQIQTSADATSWNTIYSSTTGTGGTQTLTISGTGRFIRMYGTARATGYGYSLYEFIVHTLQGAAPPPTDQPIPTSPATGTCPWVNSTAPIADRVTQLMAAMTPTQKTEVLHGNDAASPYIGNMAAVPELCIPAMGLQDGPSGVGDGLGGVTQMPAGVNAAATFDTSLVQQYGSAIGNEFARKGANVALGPTINIARDPRWGRNFEAFGEDPYLAGKMATADIRGLQSWGVMAQVKHAAVYNIELGAQRATPADNAIVNARTENEIYLPAFQAATADGASASVMCSYNMINSVYACENDGALNKGIKQAANWGGFVNSDWGAIHSTAPSANGGEDMEMPGGGFFNQNLINAVSAGQVTQARFDDMVRRVLTQMFAFGLFNKAPTGSPTAIVTNASHTATARKVAEDSAVLLKNTNNALPITSATTSIAVLGGDAAAPQTTGGGSATVSSSGGASPVDAIRSRAGSGTTVTYVEGAGEHTTTPNIAAAVTAARNAQVAIVFASYSTQELTDLTSIDLQNQQNDLISQVAAANPRTIVVLNTGSAVTMPWLGSVAGVIESFYPGQEFGNAIAALLYGDVDPSGKLPVSFPQSLADVPAHTTAQWPGANNQIQYSEGMNVGYRWYTSQNIAPLFPFGYGQSYTTFAMSNLAVGARDAAGNFTVTATVTNSGSRAGAEVAQLYVTQPAANGSPPIQLKGFQKVSLAAGASTTVSFPLTNRDLAHFDTTSSSWVANAGAYTVRVGDSSTNLPLTGTVTVGTTVTVPTTLASATTPAVTNPGGMTSKVGQAASLALKATGTGLTWQATGLPAGLTINASTGVISGTATAPGTGPITATARDSAGNVGEASFVWTTT